MFCCSTPLIYELLMDILLQMRGTSNNFFTFIALLKLSRIQIFANDYKMKMNTERMEKENVFEWKDEKRTNCMEKHEI